jgi:uncharacterized protein YyaL (SSP411 family)
VYAPGRIVLAVPGNGAANQAAAVLPASIADKPSWPGGAAYVCRGSHCTAALTSLEALVAELKV